MRKTLPVLAAGLAAMLLLGFTGCPSENEEAQPQARRADLKVDAALVTATNDFGFRLYRELAKNNGGKNLILSPTSLELALGMTGNGAAGETRTAMMATLGVAAMTRDDFNAANAQLLALLNNPDARVQLSIADALWGRQGVAFHPDFLRRARDGFAARVDTLDFASPEAAGTINRWVGEQTRGKIPELFAPRDVRDALMVLVNALYFKGLWTAPFDTAQTRDGAFTGGDGKTKTLPMMRRAAKFPYLETETFQAVGLPYGDKYVSMYLFLPRAGTSLAELTAALTPAKWAAWMAQFSAREGTVVLPRFKADYTAQEALKTALAALGMGAAFDPARADFADLLAPGAQVEGRIYLSTVVHKTVLEVNEEGTEAAAATGAGVGVTAVPAAPFTLTVDRPFFFAIRDNPTGAILFLGTVSDPK